MEVDRVGIFLEGGSINDIRNAKVEIISSFQKQFWIFFIYDWIPFFFR